MESLLVSATHITSKYQFRSEDLLAPELSLVKIVTTKIPYAYENPVYAESSHFQHVFRSIFGCGG